uniref:F-box domain-containing protein n=1 Tax=Oryza barthii TaxID=65489 RepID=A0A0D3HBS7_9ORYZ
MPPRRRGAPRGAAAARLAPYQKGWLSRRRRRRRGRTNRRARNDDRDGNGTFSAVPDSVLANVFTRFPDAADLVRCAATCRRWSRVIADAAALLCRSLPVLPRLALGFFYQEAAAGKRKRSAAAGQTCRFVPTAAGARLLGPSLSPFVDGGELFEYSRPVTSRNGRVVLELRREGHADGLKLCVWNPMTGDVATLPPLHGDDKPGAYACALLTADDLDDPPPSSPTFFRVLVVYNRRTFTALRSYSSDTGRWSAEARRSGPKLSSYTVHHLRQSVVHGGVAYWPLAHTAFAVRADTPEPEEMPMPPAVPKAPPHDHLLGISPDGKLSFIVTSSNGDCTREQVAICTWRVRLHELRVHRSDAMNLRWFCERSGLLFFTIDAKGSSTPGAYVLNVATKELEKVADDIDCSSWRNFVGYEMDHASYLASVACY